MSNFLDRLNTARYTSPSGQVFLLNFRQLSRSGAKKATIDELPNQNSGIIQQQGEITTKYPFQIFFYGKDYDIMADKFYAAMREKGIATMDHPRWKERKVVPISYSQNEDFVDEMMVARFDVDFFEYEEKESKVSKAEKKSKFQSKLDKFKEVAKLDFLNNLKLQNLIEKSKAMKEFNSLLDSCEAGLQAINQTKAEINNQINTILRNINRVEGLITDAQTTIESIITLNFISLDTNDSIANLFNSHKSTQSKYAKTYVPNSNRENLATALQLQVFYSCSVAAMTAAAVNADFTSKAEAVSILNSIQDSMETFISFQETLQNLFSENTVDDSYIFSSDTFNYLQELSSITYSYILTQLYELKMEQKITLEKEITPLALSYELYGTIEKLDDLIAENELEGFELLLLPIGKEIKIYV